ncbi:MAG: hypothetical protein HZB91_07135 [Elusimicrobia bacterium]|nr:hypothetical protein [Elusimicrobiota bacterium]
MSPFYKKRRNTGPSKNDLKVQRGAEVERRARSGDTVGRRFPTVQRLSIRLEIMGPQGQLFSDETRVLNPVDRCNFEVACPGRCGGGKFNLEAKVDSVVGSREIASESSGVCQNPIYAGSSEVCGCRLSCKIEAAYKPEQAEADRPV